MEEALLGRDPDIAEDNKLTLEKVTRMEIFEAIRLNLSTNFDLN